MRRQRADTLFPYTTLFRSRGLASTEGRGRHERLERDALVQTRRDLSHGWRWRFPSARHRSEEHTSELQSQSNIVCRLLLEIKNAWINLLVVLNVQCLTVIL